MPTAKKPKRSSRESKAPKKLPLHGDRTWFERDRLGMFIHWGTYSLAARHEWVKKGEALTDEAYQTYFDHFDPDLYDPTAWAKMAKRAGMKYFCITTKHHEGFCLWDTKYTDYKVTNTPYGKDLIGPMVKAFRAEGLKVGFYYSLLDWHHPDFPVDRFHPRCDDEAFRKAAAGRDVRKYARYMHNQVRELLTQFGKIDYLFFDFSYPGDDGKGRDDWQSEKLLKLCRQLQPKMLINDRLDLRDVPGGLDLVTPEQHMKAQWPTDEKGNKLCWETCQTFSGSWGYYRDEETWKSVPQLLYLLIDTVSKGGNLLLNVGPTARGLFDQRAQDALAGMGRWMDLHERSIVGCTQAPAEFAVPADTRLTWNPKTKRLYVHFLHWPIREFALPGLGGKVTYAQLLNDASEIRMRDSDSSIHVGLAAETRQGDVTLELPVKKPLGVDVPVVELFME